MGKVKGKKGGSTAKTGGRKRKATKTTEKTTTKKTKMTRTLVTVDTGVTGIRICNWQVFGAASWPHRPPNQMKLLISFLD